MEFSGRRIFTQYEKSLLLELVARRPIITDKRSRHSILVLKRTAWKQVHEEFLASVGENVSFCSVEQLKKLFSNLKAIAVKQRKEERKERCKNKNNKFYAVSASKIPQMDRLRNQKLDSLNFHSISSNSTDYPDLRSTETIIKVVEEEEEEDTAPPLNSKDANTIIDSNDSLNIHEKRRKLDVLNIKMEIHKLQLEVMKEERAQKKEIFELKKKLILKKLNQ